MRDLVLENSDPDLGARQSPSPAEFEQLAEYAKNTTDHTLLSGAWRSRIGDDKYKKMMAAMQN